MKKILKAIWKAWRPFSLTAAFIPTTLGAAVSLLEGVFQLETFVLVTIGGLLLQSGVNFINDFFEFKSGILPEKNPQLTLTFKNRLLLEYFIFFMGLGSFALVVPIGLYLTWKSGLELLWIGVIGFIGGYCYTGKPFSYKDKALGVVLVFFLMGVLMVYGTYFAFTSRFSWQAILISLPISCLVSLLLVSNEIRDIEEDENNRLHTLSVLLGYKNAKRLYFSLMVAAYLFVFGLVLWRVLPILSLITFLSLPYGLGIYKQLNLPLPQRRIIVPKTANLHFFFGILFIGSLLIDLWIRRG